MSNVYGAPSTPAPPPGMANFNQALPGEQASILANQGKIGGMADKAGAASQGIDPRFAQYANAMNSQLQTQRGFATNQLTQRFADTGMGNSTAAVNEQNKLNFGYDQQQNVLSGQVGLQGLQNSNEAAQFRAQLMGQQNSMGNDVLQNYLANPAMQVAQTAAQNAGKNSGGGGGKGGK